MHRTLGRDHLALVLVVGLLVALWPAGSMAPLAEAGLYVAPLVLFAASLSLLERLERAFSE